MIIYIAGRITGDRDYEGKFQGIKRRIEGSGHIVLNPASLPKGMPGEKYMPICFAMIDQADAVFMMEDWENSKGARIEKSYAEYQKKRIMLEINTPKYEDGGFIIDEERQDKV